MLLSWSIGCSDISQEIADINWDCGSFDGTKFEDICEPIIDEDLDEIEEFFTKKPELLDYYDDSTFYSPILLAAYLNKTESLEKLFELGADPNITTADGSIPLIDVLSVHASKATIKILLENGADASYINSNPKAPFPTALSVPSTKPEVYFMLIEYGADPNYKTENNFGGFDIPLKKSILRYKYNIAYRVLVDYEVDYKYKFNTHINGKEFYIKDYLLEEQPPLLSEEQLKYRDSILMFLDKNK
ncbi:MAG: hypothetical protein Kapaf2KO_12530 [Candidatus Kapaibacteriales bacterium]